MNPRNHIIPAWGLILFALATPNLSFAVTRTFVGATDANWNTASNWSPSGVPASTDSLVFGASALSSNNNNPSGTMYRDLDFNLRHSLSGNPFDLTHGITASGGLAFGYTITPAVTLNANQTFTVSSSTLTFTNGIALNGSQLSVNGAGTVAINGIVTGTGANSRIVKTGTGTLRLGDPSIVVHDGGFSVSAGTLEALGISSSPVTLSGGILQGEGQVGPVTATGGQIIADGGDLTASGGLTLGSGVTVKVKLTGPGSAGQGTADSISVSSGAVDLGNAQLVIDTSAYLPTVHGSQFNLLIKSTAGAITGTFAGIPEGGEVQLSPDVVGRISYLGGNGNDVEMTISSMTRTWNGGAIANDNWDDADNWTNNALPQTGDRLIFPAGIQGTDQGMDNNFPNDTTFRRLVFGENGYRIRGNRFRLTHGIEFDMGYGQVDLDTDLVLAANQSFDFGPPAIVAFGKILKLGVADEISTNGRTLTLTGHGIIDGKIRGTGHVVIAPDASIEFRAPSDYSGLTTIQAGSTLLLFRDTLALVHGEPGNTTGETRVSGTLRTDSDNFLGTFNLAENLVLLPGGLLFAGGGYNNDVEFSGTLRIEGPEEATIDGLVEESRFLNVISGPGPFRMEGGITIHHFMGSQPNTFTGPMTVDAVDVVLDKSSNGVLAVSGSGLRIENGGRVETRKNEQIANTCDVTISGGTLRIGQNNQQTETIGDLTLESTTGANAVETPNNSLLDMQGNLTKPGASTATLNGINLRVGGAPSLFQVDAGELQLGAALNITRLNTDFIRKTGVGTLRMAGTLSAPLTVAEGTLDFTGSTAFLITLGGGTLIGDGGANSGVSSITGGGIISPGQASGDREIFTTGGLLSLNGSTTLRLELATIDPLTGFDRLVINGTVNLGGSTLQLEPLPGFNPPIGTTLPLLSNDGADAVNGAFAGLPQGAHLAIPGPMIFQISYVGGTGNDVTISRVNFVGTDLASMTLTPAGGATPPGTLNADVTGKGMFGLKYRLEGSSNLTTWVPLPGVPVTTADSLGDVDFPLLEIPPSTIREFYRVVWVP